MTMPTSTDVKDFQHDLDAIRADIAGLTDTVGRLASEAVNAAVGKNSKKAMRGVRRAGDELWEETHELGDDVLSAAQHQIARNPMGAVMIALGIGIVLGLVALK
jgi:ElaB/YqjD/DUF883 family membrane-anchored ribosome-binding protein